MSETDVHFSGGGLKGTLRGCRHDIDLVQHWQSEMFRAECLVGRLRAEVAAKQAAYNDIKDLKAEIEGLRDELAMARGTNWALEEWIRGHRIAGRSDAMPAQGIEARSAETQRGSVVDESPVGSADAPTPTPEP